jgi:hypothetical protein
MAEGGKWVLEELRETLAIGRAKNNRLKVKINELIKKHGNPTEVREADGAIKQEFPDEDQFGDCEYEDEATADEAGTSEIGSGHIPPSSKNDYHDEVN